MFSIITWQLHYMKDRYGYMQMFCSGLSTDSWKLFLCQLVLVFFIDLSLFPEGSSSESVWDGLETIMLSCRLASEAYNWSVGESLHVFGVTCGLSCVCVIKVTWSQCEMMMILWHHLSATYSAALQGRIPPNSTFCKHLKISEFSLQSLFC